MKQATFLAAALFSATLISGRLHAQDNTTPPDLAINQPRSTSANASSAAHPNDVAVSALSVRAIKDFKSRFTKVTDESWGRSDKGFCVSFTNDGFKVRAYYDRKGNWLASLKYCDESQLPHFIRDIVKRTYYDLAITHVNIIQVPEHIAYLVHLEDQKTFRIVRVNEEGEMNTVNEYIKAN